MRYVLSMIMLSLSFVGFGFAQFDRSALSGIVADQNGAVVPGVIVKVVQSATGLSRETITRGDGSYVLPALQVGRYVVTFNKPGFRTVRIEDVDQVVGVTRTLNATMIVAENNVEITIRGTVAQLDQTTASLGGRIERKQISELPLNGRNWYSLTALAPGASAVDAIWLLKPCFTATIRHPEANSKAAGKQCHRHPASRRPASSVSATA